MARIIFGPKRVPGSQTNGTSIWTTGARGDAMAEVLFQGINKGGDPMTSTFLRVPRAALPDLIAALRKIDAGPLETQLIEMEEKDGR